MWEKIWKSSNKKKKSYWKKKKIERGEAKPCRKLKGMKNLKEV